MAVKHPHWQCPGCGITLYYLGAVHHGLGCDEHPGREKYLALRKELRTLLPQ
jgi:hypothetical protein